MAEQRRWLAVVWWSSLAVALATGVAQAAPGWPPNRAGAARSMRHPLDFSPLLPRDRVVLSTRIAAPVAVTSDGELVSLGEDGVLERTRSDGHARWDLLLGPSLGAPALAPNGTCFVASWDEQLYAVDDLGRLRWTRTLGARPRGGVAVADGLVVVALENGLVRWYAARDGARIAEVSIGALPSSGPARSPDHALLVPTSRGEVVKLDGRRVIWRAWLGEPAVGPLAVDGSGASYAVVGDGVVVRIGADGTIGWRAAVAGALPRSPALSGDGAVFVATQRALVALDARTARRRWEAPVGDTLVGGPLVADDGNVYVSAVRGARSSDPAGVALAIAGDGTIATTIRLPALPVAGLTLSDHKLWVGLKDATLLGVRVAPEGLAASSPWPKARGNLRNSGTGAP